MNSTAIATGIACLVLIAAGSVKAEVLTRCGASKGYSYYFESALVPRERAGWMQDGISSGNLVLMRDGSHLDIAYTDAVGTRSMRADGFDVLDFSVPNSGFVTVIAISPRTGVIQHYLFRLDAVGRGSVAWGHLRGGGTAAPKSALYEATCSGK